MTEVEQSSPASAPETIFDAQKEIRLAVVMYGGVSLAIYNLQFTKQQPAAVL